MIDDELEFRRLFHWEISGLSAFQNLVHVRSGTPEQVGKARAADLKAAITAYAQTAPLQKKLSEAEQKLADTGKEVVDTNKRIDEIDQYELVKVVTVPFAAKNATLTDKAKAQLDELASNAPGAKNYLIEVKGYTDVTGPASENLDLGLSRADAVVQYLAVKNIPLRRMTIPMGYGETKSSATTAAGRAAENTMDVRILVNKGLSNTN